jgi:hypothetical protein
MMALQIVHFIVGYAAHISDFASTTMSTYNYKNRKLLEKSGFQSIFGFVIELKVINRKLKLNLIPKPGKSSETLAVIVKECGLFFLALLN